MSGSETISFRPLDRSAEHRLHEINRRCPIQADFTFFFDREPDFFAWPDRNFEKHRYTGIFEGETLVGYGMAGLNHGHVGTTQRPYLYVGDWRIVPEARGRRLAEQAVEALVDSFPDDVVVGFSLIKRGNIAAETIAKTAQAQRWVPSHLCSFEAVNLLPIMKPRRPRRFAVRRATPSDKDEMADLARKAWRGRTFAPHLTSDDWEKKLSQNGTTGYFLAESGSRLVGLLGVSDTHHHHRITVLGYSSRGNLVRFLYRQARRVARHLPALPQPQSAFRTLTVHDVAVADSDPTVLRDLLKAVLREHHGQGYHMVHVGFPGDDPLKPAVGWFPSQKFMSEIMIATRRDALSSIGDIDRTNPWIDLLKI